MIIKLNRAKDGREFTFGPYDVTQSTVEDDRANALIADNLSIDTFSFTLKSRDSDYEPLIDENDEYVYDENNELIYARALSYATVDFTQYTKYEDIVRLYSDDNVLLGKYYVESVSASGNRSGEITYTCVSIMGVLDNMQTHGGIYSNASAGDLISELMGSYGYTIDGTLASAPVYGWIPAGTRRDALKQILFPLGASMLKDSNGDPDFTFNLPTTADVVENTFIGGELTENSEAANRIELTEHSFYASQSVQATVIYENSNGLYVDHAEIIFDEPYHTLIGTGITIHESGANYAIISGTGSLTGIPYVHIQRILNADTEAHAVNNVKSFSDAYLVSPLNSTQCLKRLVNYYGQTAEVSVDFQGGAHNPGSLINVVSPTDYTERLRGYIKSIKRSFSKIIKASAKLTYNWTPKYIGNAYDSFMIVRKPELSGNTWLVPPDIRGKHALVVLFGGAQGGQGGWYGATPNDVRGLQSFASRISDRTSIDYYVGNPGNVGQGGQGGNGGEGGFPGKMIMFNIASLGNSYPVTLGAGGAGGAGGTVTRSTKGWLDITEKDPTNGTYGGHSTMNGYDTNDGVYIEADFVNLINGSIIAPQHGPTGSSGGNGGNGGPSRPYVTDYNSTYDYTASGRGKNGASVGSNTGGNGADGAVGYNLQAYNYSQYARYHHIALAGGGGGGGAAVGGNGSAGEVQTSFNRVYDNDDDSYEVYTGRIFIPSEGDTTLTSSNGGNGANAVTVPAQTDLCGGKGGNGGGGGGGAGSQLGWDGAVYLDNRASYGWGYGGKGGNGADGGQGSDGFFVVYYKGGDILPSGYTQLEYIECTGAQYIVTGVSGESDVTIVLTAQAEETNTNQIWACRSRTGYQWFGRTTNDGKWLGCDIDATTKIDATLHFTDTQYSGIANGEQVLRVQAPTTKTYVTFLAHSGGAYFATGKLFRAGAILNGAWAFLGIPAKNSSNVAGLYDLVSGTFYPSNSSTPFVAGPEV